MKRLLAGLFLVSCISPAQARDIESSLGYKATVPDGWVVLTREEVKANPDLFDFEKSERGGMPRELLEKIKPMILNGKADFFLRKGKTADFTDNVNIMKLVGNVSTAPDKIKTMCGRLGKDLEEAFKHAVNAYSCGSRKVEGRPAVYLDFDGVVAGTRSLQYQVPRSENVFYVITATAVNSRLNIVRKEFDQIMRSFSLH